MSYTRVTGEERRLIYEWRQAGKGIREMSVLLGRSPGTVSREIRRNTGGKGYRPRQAQELASARARRAGPRRFTGEVRSYAEEKLRHYSQHVKRDSGASHVNPPQKKPP